MELNLGDIFKSPYFNRMVAALAVASIIAAFIYPESKVILILAIAFSVYTLFSVIVWLKNYSDHKKYVQSIKEENQKYEDEKAKEKKAQAEFIFGRLSRENQQLLASIIRDGEMNGYSNCRIFKDKQSVFPLISKLNTIIYDDYLFAKNVTIEQTSDSVSIYIEPNLYKVIEDKMNSINQ